VDIDELRRLKAAAAATPLPTVPLDNPRSIAGATLPQTPKTMAQTAAATPLPAQPTAAEIAAARQAKATAFLARKAAADALLNLVDGAVFAAKPAALVKACADKCGYADTSKQLSAAEKTGRWALADTLLTKKINDAQGIKPAIDDLNAAKTKAEYETIRKAGACLMACKGAKEFAAFARPFEAARRSLVDAEQSGDLLQTASERTATAAIGASIVSLHKGYFAIHNAMPMRHRAAEAIAKDSDGKISETVKMSFKETSDALETFQTTGDYTGWEDYELAVNCQAAGVLKAAYEAEAQAWLNDGLRQPLPDGKSMLGRVFGGKRSPSKPQSSADPILQPLSEVEKYDAIERVFKQNSINNLDQIVLEKYKLTKIEGLNIDLSPVQIAAIYSYTGPSYDAINTFLRDRAAGKLSDSPQPDVEVLVAVAKEALTRLPVYDPTGFPLFRFEKLWPTALTDRYVPGKVFTVPDFWSSGAGAGADIKGGANAEIVIWGKKQSAAKNIGPLSELPDEGKRRDRAKLKGQGNGEVVFPPDCKFKTVAVTDVTEAGNVQALGREKRFRYRIEVMEV